ncbi:phospholipid scramblase 1-like isoform X2 [Amphiura filiformis]
MNQPRSGHGGKQMQWMSPPEQRPLGCPPGLEYLTQIDQILIYGEVEPFQDLTGLPIVKDRLTNQYQIKNSLGQQVYFAYEESEVYQRNCCGRTRAFSMHITDNLSQEVIRITRPFKCCAGYCWCADPESSCSMELHVESPPGQVVGYVKQTKSIWSPLFAVQDGNQQTVLKISGPCNVCQSTCCTGDIDFRILDQDGSQKIGRIAKQWGGMEREWAQHATTFRIEFPVDLDVKLKALLIGATFLIDYMYFERSKRKTSVRVM